MMRDLSSVLVLYRYLLSFFFKLFRVNSEGFRVGINSFMEAHLKWGSALFLRSKAVGETAHSVMVVYVDPLGYTKQNRAHGLTAECRYLQVLSCAVKNQGSVVDPPGFRV